MAGLTEFQAEDHSRGKGQGTDEQPSPATLSSSRAPNQKLASDPLACRPALNLLPEASSGVRNGGWIWGVDSGGLFMKMHGSAVFGSGKTC